MDKFGVSIFCLHEPGHGIEPNCHFAGIEMAAMAAHSLDIVSFS